MNKLEAEVIRAVDVSLRTVCTLADVQNLIWELWESVPAEFKKVSEDKA